jgi:hypothetical protein
MSEENGVTSIATGATEDCTPSPISEEFNEGTVVINPASSNSTSEKASFAKLSTQLKRLNDANAKYKNLLKLAKDRIQKQEEEVEELRKGKQLLEERLINDEKEAAGHIGLEEAIEKTTDTEAKIVNVTQRIKVPVANGDGIEEIWALVEMELERENDTIAGPIVRRYKEWKRFNSETVLQDFIRRDTGEPLSLPPYSLSPEQSARIQREAENQISKITEEFRRFRVRSELARKQADSQIKDLQNNQIQRATQLVTGQKAQKEIDKIRSLEMQIEKIKADVATKEAEWKESLISLVAENKALKSSGSEALLASQWRQRYETCLKDKEELESRLKSTQSIPGGDDKYEEKYRDLKGRYQYDPVLHFCPMLSTNNCRFLLDERILPGLQKEGKGDF